MTYDIINELQIIVNTGVGGDVSSNIARALLESIHKDIGELTINELADRCYTSISTISRFAKSLECDSFNELKKKCVQRRENSKEIIEDNLENMNFDGENDNEILVDFADSISMSLKEFALDINLDEIDKLVDLIYEHKEVNFFGIQLPGFFMQYLQYLFLNIGKYVNFRAQEIEQYNLAEKSGSDSLSIIFSVDGNFLHSKATLFYKLKESGGKVILITQNPALKMAGKCDEVIYLGSYTSAKDGRYKIQLFSEILINRYQLKYPTKIK